MLAFMAIFPIVRFSKLFSAVPSILSLVQASMKGLYSWQERGKYAMLTLS
jgi:hypothetical protein